MESHIQALGLWIWRRIGAKHAIDRGSCVMYVEHKKKNQTCLHVKYKGNIAKNEGDRECNNHLQPVKHQLQKRNNAKVKLPVRRPDAFLI